MLPFPTVVRGPFVSAYYYCVATLSKRHFGSLDTLVVSAGGVGTTLLIGYLRQYKVTNDPHGRDFLKHLPRPPLRAPRRLRSLYVFGDPVQATLSLAARGYLNHQIRKNGNWRCLRVFRDVEEYARNGRDELYLTRSLSRWSDPENCHHETLLIRYESLWKHIDHVLSFLSIDAMHANAFPKRRSRSNATTFAPKDLVGALEMIYRDYYRLSENLGEVRRLSSGRTTEIKEP